MRIEQLQYLVEIHKTRSFTAAAANLFVTQPAISEAIKKLEQELDVQLIQRTSSAIEFTPIGMETIYLAQSILKAIGTIKENAAQSKAQSVLPLCALTIFTVPIINESLILKFLPLFHALQPNVCFNIYEASVNAIFDAIKSGRCNMGIFHAIPQRVNQTFAESAIITGAISSALDSFVLTDSAGPLSARKSIALQELSDLPLALSTIDANDELILDFLFRPEGIAPKVVFRSNKRDLIFAEVRSGRAVCLTHSVILTNLPDGLRVIPIAGAPPLGLYYTFSSLDTPPNKTAIHHFLQAFIPFCQNILPSKAP